jgi:hypothetical protein
VIPLLAEGQDAWDPAPVETLAGVDHRVTWRPGTRRAERAEVVLRRFGGEEARIELEPIYDFQMLGIGYLHPRWSHGTWQGVAETGSERYVLADLDPLALQHLHVQALCRARWGEREGIGILEQLVIGVHAPSGFTGLLDGAATPQ